MGGLPQTCAGSMYDREASRNKCVVFFWGKSSYRQARLCVNKCQKMNSIGLERHNLKRQNDEMKFRIATYARVLVLAFVFIGSNLIGDAIDDLKKKAEQGDANAQNILGLMYNNGEGVTQDYKEAVKWFTKAAEQGYASAQYNLGLMYDMGNGVTQDYVQAHAWVNVSSANGNNNGQKGRDLIAEIMTPEQIAKAQELAKQYFEKYQPKK